MDEYKPKPDFMFRTTPRKILIGGGFTLLTFLATFELFSQGCSQTKNLEEMAIQEQTEINNQTTYLDSTQIYQ